MTESRLFKILYLLLERGRTTAPELASLFEVSIRTIYRDVDKLSLAGIPIYCSPGKGGGIFLMKDFVLDKALFSESERDELLAALQGLQVITDAEQVETLAKLQSLFQVQATSWLEVDFTDWRKKADQKELFDTIRQAILQRRVLSFSYLNGRGEREQRKIEALKLVFKSQNWYVAGFCRLRQAPRFFKLNRMRDCQMLEERFKQRVLNEKFSPKERLRDTVKVLLKFDKKHAFRVYEEFSEAEIEETDGGIYVETHLPSHDSLYTYLLSFLDGVEIMEPPRLREEFKEKLKAIADIYKS